MERRASAGSRPEPFAPSPGGRRFSADSDEFGRPGADRDAARLSRCPTSLRALGQWDSLYGYFFGRLGQGWFGLMIRVMSCIIIHDPGMSTPEFNSTTIVIRSVGR